MAILATNRCVELREVHLKQKPQALIDLSPKATVPVLVVPASNQSDQSVIEESIEIMQWSRTGMESQWPQAVPNKLTALIDQQFKPVLDIYKYNDRHDDVAVDSATKKCNDILRDLDSILERDTWLSGNRFSFTDIAIFPFIRQLHYAGAKLLKKHDNAPFYPHLASWLQRTLASELFSRSMERFPVWTESAPGPLFYRQMPSRGMSHKSNMANRDTRAKSDTVTPNGTPKVTAITTDVHVAAFYRFTPISNLQALKAALIEQIDPGVLGTILIAPEGINANIASRDFTTLETLLETIAALIGCAPLTPHLHRCKSMPFRALKIRLKTEIVTFRADTPVSFETDARGSYISPGDWNALIDDEETIVIDTRNDYEISLGSFRGAINPRTRSFGEFKDYVRTALSKKKDSKIAMFCTGGIRCEKASRWMKSEGYSEVYQLSGGILGYLAKTPKESSTWYGDCFVFDDRIAVNHELEPTPMPICPECGAPFHPADGCTCTVQD